MIPIDSKYQTCILPQPETIRSSIKAVSDLQICWENYMHDKFFLPEIELSKANNVLISSYFELRKSSINGLAELEAFNESRLFSMTSNEGKKAQIRSQSV